MTGLESIPISTVISGVTSLTIRLSEYTFSLATVDSETKDLLKMIEHVDTQLKEARRAYELKSSLVSAGERQWIEHTIKDAEDSVRDLALVLESCRVDHQTNKGRVRIKNRFAWVVWDRNKVHEKQRLMNMCHSTLLTVVNFLHSKAPVILPSDNPRIGTSGHEVPRADTEGENPPTYEMSQMLAWRRSKRQSYMPHNRAPLSDFPDLDASSDAPQFTRGGVLWMENGEINI